MMEGNRLLTPQQHAHTTKWRKYMVTLEVHHCSLISCTIRVWRNAAKESGITRLIETALEMQYQYWKEVLHSMQLQSTAMNSCATNAKI